MECIIQKKMESLTGSEKDQIAALIQNFYPTAGADFIKDRISNNKGYDIILIKEGETVLGTSYYRVFRRRTPLPVTRSTLSQQTIPVIEFGSAYKLPTYRKNLIWRTGHFYAQRNIGRLYPLKKTIGISKIFSPKVFEQFIRLFPNYFTGEGSEPFQGEALELVRSIFSHDGLSIGDDFCFESPYVNPDDISDHWERTFKANDQRINDFFFRAGVLKKVHGRIYRTKRCLVACGYRTPFRILPRIFGKAFSKGEPSSGRPSVREVRCSDGCWCLKKFSSFPLASKPGPSWGPYHGNENWFAFSNFNSEPLFFGPFGQPYRFYPCRTDNHLASH